MTHTAPGRTRAPFSPAWFVAVLALVLASGGVTYAAATITGADIVNGTVTTRDIKNNNLRMKDMSAGVKSSIRQSGARAVATVYGSSSGDCFVIADESRGFTGECTRNGLGDYTLPLKATVNTNHTAPICGFRGDVSITSTSDLACSALIVGGDSLRVIVTYHNDTTTNERLRTDAAAVLPAVVILP